jgi:hypothetical protein
VRVPLQADSYAIPVTTFEGLLPALDRRQPQVPYVVDGRDYLMDAMGPYAAFGATLVGTSETLTAPMNACSFEVGANNVFYFDSSKVKKFDITINAFVDLFDFSSKWVFIEDWPWSAALVGNRWYFANKNLSDNLIIYNPIDGSFKFFTNAVDLPSGITSVTQAAGRLITLGAVRYTWSAIDDGTDYSPGQNAGFQGLSIIGGGDPLAVHELSGDFLVYTTNGVVYAAALQNTLVWRHTAFNRDIRVNNAFSIVNIESEEHVILGESGFMNVTPGKLFALYQDLFTEYFIRELYPAYGRETRLAYDRVFDMIYVSQKQVTMDQAFYDISFALNRRLNKWGSFNRAHCAILPIYYPYKSVLALRWGYVNSAGRTLIFNDRFDLSIQDWNGGLTNSSPNSYVKVGMFRFTQQRFDDEVAKVTDFSIGFSDKGSLDESFEDWGYNNGVSDPNPGRGNQDWNTGSPDTFEDWGKNVINRASFNVKIEGTLDGETIFQFEDPPNLEVEKPNQNFYTCDVQGGWFAVTVSATNSRQTYHLKYLEMSGNAAGRL